MIGAKPAGQASGHQEALASASPGQLIEEAENKAAQILQAAGFAVERQQAELAEELEAEREAAKHRAAMMKARADEQLAGLSSRIQLNVRGTVIECYTMNGLDQHHEGSLPRPTPGLRTERPGHQPGEGRQCRLLAPSPSHPVSRPQPGIGGHGL
jgi:hypothetical protein